MSTFFAIRFNRLPLKSCTDTLKIRFNIIALHFNRTMPLRDLSRQTKDKKCKGNNETQYMFLVFLTPNETKTSGATLKLV